MAHITEHHSEEEWVRHHSQDCWIGLAVVRYTVSVDNVLEPVSHFSSLDVGGHRDLVVGVSLNPNGRKLCDDVLNLLVFRSPEKSCEGTLRPLHHVESQVKGLFAG